jgi:hypothetical protein
MLGVAPESVDHGGRPRRLSRRITPTRRAGEAAETATAFGGLAFALEDLFEALVAFRDVFAGAFAGERREE